MKFLLAILILSISLNKTFADEIPKGCIEMIKSYGIMQNMQKWNRIIADKPMKITREEVLEKLAAWKKAQTFIAGKIPVGKEAKEYCQLVLNPKESIPNKKEAEEYLKFLAENKVASDLKWKCKEGKNLAPFYLSPEEAVFDQKTQSALSNIVGSAAYNIHMSNELHETIPKDYDTVQKIKFSDFYETGTLYYLKGKPVAYSLGGHHVVELSPDSECGTMTYIHRPKDDSSIAMNMQLCHEIVGIEKDIVNLLHESYGTDKFPNSGFVSMLSKNPTSKEMRTAANFLIPGISDEIYNSFIRVATYLYTTKSKFDSKAKIGDLYSYSKVCSDYVGSKKDTNSAKPAGSNRM